MRVPAFLALCLIAPAADAQLTSRSATAAPRPTTPPLIDSRGSGPGTRRDLGDIRDRIEHGRDDGSLSRREARALKRESRLVDTLADRFGEDGLSASEQRELDTRAHILRDQVNVRRTRGTGGTAPR